MSVGTVPTQVGGVAVLGAAAVRSGANAVVEAVRDLPNTGGDAAAGVFDQIRGALVAGGALLTVGAALIRGGRSHRMTAGDPLD